MTSNAENNSTLDAHNRALSRIAKVSLVAQGIRQDSPEHARFIARELELQSPPPQSDFLPVVPLDHGSVHASESAASLERHQRKCTICSHPDREEIEEFFLRWHEPFRLCQEYDVPVRSLYRHAHATGLYTARQGNLRAALDHILEGAQFARSTGDTILRAVRAYACLNADNKWVEPSTHVIVSTQRISPADQPPIAAQPPSQAHETPSLIDTQAIRK